MSDGEVSERVDNSANDVPPLSLGVVIGGGTASRAWKTAVTRLGRKIIAAREGVTSSLAINVIYDIPGELIQPNYTGVQVGRFSRKNRELLIQIALPPEPTSDADAEVLSLLHEAVELAEEFGRRRGLLESQL